MARVGVADFSQHGLFSALEKRTGWGELLLPWTSLSIAWTNGFELNDSGA
jgi:hypothetical protein